MSIPTDFNNLETIIERAVDSMESDFEGWEIPRGLVHTCAMFPDCDAEVIAPALFCSDCQGRYHDNNYCCRRCKKEPVDGYPVCRDHMRLLASQIIRKHIKVVRDYMENVKEYEDACETTQDQEDTIESLETRVKELLAQQERLVADSAARVDTTEVERLTARLSETEKELLVKENKYQELLRDYSKNCDDYNKLQVSKNHWQDQFIVVENKTKKEIADLKNRNAVLEKKIGETAMNNVRLRSDNEKLAQDKVNYQRSISDLRNQISVKNKHIDDRVKRIQELETETISLKKDIKTFHMTNIMINQETAAVKSDNARLQKTNTEMATQITGLNNEVETLRETTNAIAEERDNLRRQLETIRDLVGSGSKRPRSLQPEQPEPVKRRRRIIESDSEDECGLVIDED